MLPYAPTTPAVTYPMPSFAAQGRAAAAAASFVFHTTMTLGISPNPLGVREACIAHARP